MTTGNRTWRHWSGGLVWLGLAVGSGTRSTAMAQQVAPVDQRVRHASTVTGAAPRRATIKAPLVFTGATVIDVRDGRHVPDQTVIIVGNRMRAVGSANTVQVPKGARLVDARGKYLIPGLWNLHVHLFDLSQAMYRMMLANGVTGMREAGSAIPLDTFRVWKREIAAGARVGPRQIVSGRAIDECQGGTYAPAHHICVATPADAQRLVDSFRTAGADMIKTYSMSKAMYFAIAAEARRVGIPFGGHLPDWSPSNSLDGLEASDSGALILDHQTYFTPNVCGDLRSHPSAADTNAAQCTAAAQRLRRNNTWVADALGEFPFSLSDSTLQQWQRYAWAPLSASERRRLPSLADWAAAAADSATGRPRCPGTVVKYAADLPTVANTDLGHPGFGIHMFLLVRVLCGASPLWALRTATLNPAQALHLTDSLGTVEQGKLADLVLLDGDPLSNITNVMKIRAVVADGRYYDRAALNRLLVEAKADWDKAKAEADAKDAKTAANAKAPTAGHP